jgi:hypothetical protein
MFEMSKAQYEKWNAIRQRGALRYALVHNLLISILLGIAFGLLWLVSSFSYRAYLSNWYVVVTLFVILFLYILGVISALVGWLLNERRFHRFSR